MFIKKRNETEISFQQCLNWKRSFSKLTTTINIFAKAVFGTYNLSYSFYGPIVRERDKCMYVTIMDISDKLAVL